MERRTRQKRAFAGDSEFFIQGDIERTAYLTQQHQHQLQPTNQLTNATTTTASTNLIFEEFVCGFSRCGTKFRNVFEYEEHYNSAHRNVCRVCKKVYPTMRLLDLHILETHDTLFKLLAEKQKMYSCFVEGCERKFMDSQKRRLHLIDYHKYPRTFSFSLSSNPQKGKNKAKQENQEQNMKIDNQPTGTENTSPQKIESNDPFVPKNFSFGKSSASFYRPPEKQKSSKKRPPKKKLEENIATMDTEMAD